MKAEVISAVKEVPEVDIVIEIPRGSFLKRGSRGRVDFVSPLPCPFNYGAVPTLVGLEGDCSAAPLDEARRGSAAAHHRATSR